MRHRVAGKKLSRTASHRKALMRSLSTELLRHKKITTTEAKAKEAGRYVEGLIARAKRAHLTEEAGNGRDNAARRHLGRDIKDKAILRELFEVIAPKVAGRSGGFTRVVRIGRRIGDSAEMAVLELVDYNLEQDESAVRSRSKKLMSRAERVRRSQQKQKESEEATSGDSEAAAAVAAAEVVTDEVEEVADEVTASDDQPTGEAPAQDASAADADAAEGDAADDDKKADG